MTQDLASGLASELSYRYNHMKECAIHRALMRAEKSIPDPKVMVCHGMFVRTQHGVDDYEEFRWRGIPMFRIRLHFAENAATITVEHL